ncbi:MerR family transcriptional regulator [Agromyces endophyticus]|uniref:MerR family transcriptional regulator n=1 Tax=Agromyces sp. H17E-10 TaxID=2932244 RepID=UPI001FD215A6|nr:MerR family transcriptional regulator [Agromyces sp. H17E-10]UOQ87697.1 MerR family transcriptional regulator [Agromyces sp. H17E-10]
MRTAEVAERTGYSIQQVRKLEAAGVLPPAPRSSSAYREYDERHVAFAVAYRALTAAMGPTEARLVVLDAHRDRAAMLGRLDAAHAGLHREREELALARRAVETIRDEPFGDIRLTDAMTIGELAEALGLRTSTLRHWEDERLLWPLRGSHGDRIYAPADVRDARLVHQLRLAGYRIPPLRELLPSLREAGGAEAALVEREQSIVVRSSALFDATVALQRAVSVRRPADASA